MGELLRLFLSFRSLYEVNKEERSRERSEWLARSRSRGKREEGTWSVTTSHSKCTAKRVLNVLFIV
jgi:hypothetical protein